MITVFKLSNGEDMIGDVEEPLTSVEFYNIINPMLIVGARDVYGEGTMKLRDALLLSDEGMMTIPSKHVITYYKPSIAMAAYYTQAVAYSTKCTRPEIAKQIDEATQDLSTAMEAEERAARSLASLLMQMQQGKKPH